MQKIICIEKNNIYADITFTNETKYFALIIFYDKMPPNNEQSYMNAINYLIIELSAE